MQRTVAELIGNLYEQKVLWKGAHFMNENQTIHLSDNISSLKDGIDLVFSFYNDGEAQDYAWHSFHISKWECLNTAGGKQFSMFWNVWSHKYLYISDDLIQGANTNGTGDNSRFVLRYVIGY